MIGAPKFCNGSHDLTTLLSEVPPKGWVKTRIVSKRLNVGSRKHHHVIAHGLLVFLRQESLVDDPLPPKISTQSDTPPLQHQRFDQYPLIVPQPWELAKKVQLTIIGSRPRTFLRATDEPCTLPLSPPKGGTKLNFAAFAIKTQLLSKKVCCKVSLRENIQRQRCSYIIPLSNGP